VSEEDLDQQFRRYRSTRDRGTRNQLIERHIGLAQHIANRYADRGIDRDDLRQVALVGLVKAVERFDPSRGVAFSTFGGRTIEGELKRHFRDTSWRVKVPRGVQETRLAMRAASEDLTHQLGRAPTARELADHLGASVDEVVDAIAAGEAYGPRSLDDGGRSSGEGPGADHDAALASIDRNMQAVEQRVAVRQLLEKLPERERTIVELRFFEGLTQAEIAHHVGLSQMHVSRLLRKSFLELRRHL